MYRRRLADVQFLKLSSQAEEGGAVPVITVMAEEGESNDFLKLNLMFIIIKEPGQLERHGH